MNTTPLHELPGMHVRFDHFNEWDLEKIAQITRRAIAWVRDYRKRNPSDRMLEPDSQIMAMDICTVHAIRGLRLYEFLLAPDDLFLNEIVTIGRCIDRTCATFPSDVFLRYADPGAIPPLPPIAAIH